MRYRKCKLCFEENETTTHFLTKCIHLQHLHMEFIKEVNQDLNIKYEMKEEELMCILVFEYEQLEIKLTAIN